MSRRVTRRDMLKASAVTAGFLAVRPGVLAAGNSPNDKLNIASIGVGGRGAANLEGVKGETITALCDVDQKALWAASKRFPEAKTYDDWRRCVDQKDLDAVVCSTTDHTHAFINVWSMNRGHR